MYADQYIFFIIYILDADFYRAAFNPDELQSLETEQKKPTLLKLVQQWLERTPGLEEDGFNFPQQYRSAVKNFLQTQKDSIKVCSCYHRYLVQ